MTKTDYDTVIRHGGKASGCKTADYKKKMAAMPKQPVNLDFEKQPVTKRPTSG
jgi:hypothetical protein